MQLILVRHGQPHHYEDARPDPPLSELGHAQAAATAARLAQEPIERIVSSGMARADATAAPLAAHLGLPVEIEPGIGEIDRYGGRYASIERIRQQGGAEWERFLADPLHYFGVDGERFRGETLAGFSRLIDGRPERTVAVFTHGFPINILLAKALGIDSIVRFVPAYASITRLIGRAFDALTVVSVNETAHFPDAQA